MPQHADMHGELVFFEQLEVRVPDGLFDVRVFHRGHAFAMEGIDHPENSVSPLLRSWRRNEIADRVHRGLLQDAGWCSLRIAIDGAGGRIFRFGGDVGQSQCFMVGYAVMSRGVGQPDRIVGRDFIQVGGQDVAALR